MEKKNIQFTRGDSFSFAVSVFDKDDNPIVVGSNGQVYFTVKADYDTSDVIVQKTLNNGITYDEDKGYIINVKPNDTNDLSYGYYVYDVEIKVGDFVKTVVMGSMELTKEVTFKENEQDE